MDILNRNNEVIVWFCRWLSTPVEQTNEITLVATTAPTDVYHYHQPGVHVGVHYCILAMLASCLAQAPLIISCAPLPQQRIASYPGIFPSPSERLGTRLQVGIDYCTLMSCSVSLVPGLP